MEKKINIKNDEILNREIQVEVDRISDKYNGCNDEFEQVGEEPQGDLVCNDILSETKVSDEEIVNILRKI